MKQAFQRAAFAALALALTACNESGGRGGRSVDQVRIDRIRDGGSAIFARKVPGGCLYHSSDGMTFAPFECATIGPRWAD